MTAPATVQVSRELARASLLADLENGGGSALAELCELVRGHVEASRVVAWAFDAEDGVLTPFEQAPDQALLDARTAAPVRLGPLSVACCRPLGWVVDDGELLQVDWEHAPDGDLITAGAAVSGPGAALLAPLVAGGAVLGVLSVEPPPADGEAALRPLLSTVSAGLAAALDRRTVDQRVLRSEVLL